MYRYKVTGQDLCDWLSPETRAEFGDHWRNQPTREGVMSIKFADGVEPPPHCACGAIAEALCDFPVAEGRTCDVAICEDFGCAHAIGHDIHYCPPHHAMWLEWRASNGYAEIMAMPFVSGLRGGSDE